MSVKSTSHNITCHGDVVQRRWFGIRRRRRVYLCRERWKVGKQRSEQVCIRFEVGNNTSHKSSVLLLPLEFLSRTQRTSLCSFHVLFNLLCFDRTRSSTDTTTTMAAKKKKKDEILEEGFKRRLVTRVAMVSHGAL